MEIIPDSQDPKPELVNEATIGDQNDPNAAYITISRLSDDIVQLVRSGDGQIQEVHVTDDDGNVNVQHVAYTLTTNDGEGIQMVTTEDSAPKTDDPSYEFYDNARGKINLNILSKLVSKYGVDEANVSKNLSLSRWNDIMAEYNAVTNQNKSRSVLMKRWASVKSSRKVEYLKSGAKKEVNFGDETSASNDPEALKKSVLIKHLKMYDSLRIEAAQYERNCRKLEMENALLENESLRKENAILDIQLEAAKLELALIQEKLQ